MSNTSTPVVYEAGEIVPQCGCTVDVYVRENETITLGGKPPDEWPEGRLVCEFNASDDVRCYRLALWAGDRLRRDVGRCHWEQTFDGAWSTSCGRVFELNEGTPAENGMRFCYRCGKTLVVEVKTGDQR